MKLVSRILLTIVLLGCAATIPTDVGPKRADFSRYLAMLDHSSFALATASAVSSFVKDLYISNVAHSPEGDVITLESVSDKNFKEYLSTKPNERGIFIKDFKWREVKCPH